jgi:DNA-binding CsgD family transcriptional regulator/tetratricopeptide (TPR) repeat protein
MSILEDWRPVADVCGIIGREAELQRLDAAVARASAGSPTVVLVVGEAGVGKTRLVEAAFERSGALVVAATADPAEAELDYAVVEQLLRRSPLPGDTVGDLTPRPGTDPLAAGAALMRFIDGLQLDRPLAVVVDDAHWADARSLDAIAFVARRLRADHAVLCLATRTDGPGTIPTGLLRLVDASGSRIHLAGLDTGALGTLAERVIGRRLPPAAVDRLHSHTAGNPLHAHALLRELSYDALVGGGSLPAPRSYAALILGRIAAAGADVERLVAALAVLGVRAALAAVTAVAEVREPLVALDGAVAGGLVTLDDRPGDRSICMAHPLIRAAVLDDLPPSRRLALHRRAGAVLSGAAGLRHRLAGCPGFDADLAADARRTAALEADQGAHGAAARFALEAARVDPNEATRDTAMLVGVDQLLLSGDLASARERRGDVELAGPGAHRSFLIGRLAYVLGPRSQARGALERAWAEAFGADGRPADPELAARIAALLATSAVDRGDGKAALAWARRARDLSTSAAADCNPGHMLAMAFALQNRVADGVAELTRSLSRPASDAAIADLRLGRGVLRLWAHELAGGGEDLGACVAPGAGGTFVTHETARYFLAELHYRAGRWDDATVTAELACSMVDETDQEWLAAFSHAVAVHPLAARGEWERADAHLAAAVSAANATAGGAARLWAGLAALRLAESRQDHTLVVSVGDELVDGGGRSYDEGIAPWRASYVESLVATGRSEDAATVTDRLATDAAPSTSPLVASELARAQIAVAGAFDDRHAGAEAVERGLALGTAPGPFARARLDLAAGRMWQRWGERKQAMGAFEAAHCRFSALEATPWAACAGAELGDAGRRSSIRDRLTGRELTAHEEAVVHVVAQGRSNRAAADELFVSVKTVEHHLSRAFAKLGVRSRTELARLVHGPEWAGRTPARGDAGADRGLDDP